MSDIWLRKPREWQEACFADYTSRFRQDYLVAVCPGGGKTELALAIAKYLLQQREINFVVTVSPTDELTRQWADKGAPYEIVLNPNAKSFAPLQQSREFNGVSMTYQALATPAAASAFCSALQLRNVLVILDEVHHAGETKAWGDGIRAGFELARRRLLLSGTPIRSDTAAIPFARYTPTTDNTVRIVRDFDYGTGRGVRDSVIRRIDFRFYDAEVTEQPFGESVTTSQNLSEAVAQADRSKLMGVVIDPASGWFRDLLPAVDKELMAIRRTVPDAGCLILANDKAQVRAYAEIIFKATGHQAATVVSEDPKARQTLDDFSDGSAPYIIAIRKVSEGVDIPRLRVLVWLTRTKTELFFAQGTARVVRIRDQADTSPAVVFLPALPVMRELAQGIEDDIAHEIKLLEDEIRSSEPGAAGELPGQTVCFDPGQFPNGPNSWVDPEDPGAWLGQDTTMPGPSRGCGQMPLPATFSVDKVALEGTMLGNQAHAVALHEQAQLIIDSDGLAQTNIALVRQLINSGRIPMPGQSTGPDPVAAVPTPAAPPVTEAVFRVRKHHQDRLHALAKQIGRQYFEDNFSWVRAEINRRAVGCGSELATAAQLQAGIDYAEQWLASLAAERKRA